MPTVKVKLPDGTIIRLEVPENATPEQIREFAKRHAAEQALISKLLKRIRIPEDGEPGKPGKPGLSIKGDKGDEGDKGKPLKGDKGDKGDDGVSIVNVQLNKKKELITTLSNGKKINAGKITEKLASDVFEVFYTNPLRNTVNLGSNIGDIIVFNGNSWVEIAVGINRQILVADSTVGVGVKWGDGDYTNNFLLMGG